MSELSTRSPARPLRKRRSDGERSRSAILHEAARLATIEGLSGLSIGRLADAVGMSKSGLFAHFGSKEELQLATIGTAGAIFSEEVLEPATSATTGLERLELFAESFLRHVEGGVFPGGCFFASVAAELDTLPEPVRDLAVDVVAQWFGRLQEAAADAQAQGQVDSAEDPGQIAFEVDSFLLLANLQYVIAPSPLPLDRARRAIARRLAAAAPGARG